MAAMEMPPPLQISNGDDIDTLQDISSHATDQSPPFRPANKRKPNYPLTQYPTQPSL